MNKKIDANKILSLLAEKHSNDVFVPECKDGSTWLGTHFRLDAWVMNRSWTKLKFTGYEIKVSRQDFLKDDKYQEYMRLCNEFYFVTSKNIIQPDEIPVSAGLLEIASTGTRLLKKKKAPFRDIEFPSSLFTYILMCRAKITKERYEPYPDFEKWKIWLNEKKEKQTVGHSVSVKLKKLYDENIYNVQEENNQLKNKMKDYDRIRDLLSEFGITDKDSYCCMRNKIITLQSKLNLNNFKQSLQHTKDILEKTLENLEKQGF